MDASVDCLGKKKILVTGLYTTRLIAPVPPQPTTHSRTQSWREAVCLNLDTTTLLLLSLTMGASRACSSVSPNPSSHVCVFKMAPPFGQTRQCNNRRGAVFSSMATAVKPMEHLLAEPRPTIVATAADGVTTLLLPQRNRSDDYGIRRQQRHLIDTESCRQPKKNK